MKRIQNIYIIAFLGCETKKIKKPPIIQLLCLFLQSKFLDVQRNRGTHNLTIATIAKMAVVLGDDIIMPTAHRVKYKIPQEENEHSGAVAAESQAEY